MRPDRNILGIFEPNLESEEGGAHNMIFVVLGYFWSLLWEVINNRIKLFLVLSCVPFQNLQLPMYIQNIALKNAIGKV